MTLKHPSIRFLLGSCRQARKASLDRFIAAEPRRRESNATAQRKSRHCCRSPLYSRVVWNYKNTPKYRLIVRVYFMPWTIPNSIDYHVCNWFRRLSINWNCPDNLINRLSFHWNCPNCWCRWLSINLNCPDNWFRWLSINWHCPDNGFRRPSINWNFVNNTFQMVGCTGNFSVVWERQW